MSEVMTGRLRTVITAGQQYVQDEANFGSTKQHIGAIFDVSTLITNLSGLSQQTIHAESISEARTDHLVAQLCAETASIVREVRNVVAIFLLEPVLPWQQWLAAVTELGLEEIPALPTPEVNDVM
jgi:hypothetical protein